MILAFGTRQDFLDVVEAAHQARPETETTRAKRCPPGPTTVSSLETGPQELIDQGLERDAPFALLPLNPHRHIVIQGHRGAHALMLST